MRTTDIAALNIGNTHRVRIKVQTRKHDVIGDDIAADEAGAYEVMSRYVRVDLLVEAFVDGAHRR